MHRSLALRESPRVTTDYTRIGARFALGAAFVVAIAFALWRVRDVVVLLILALTFAAAIRPGVEWLQRRRVPGSLAIFLFFAAGIGTFALFFWLALPPALHEIAQGVRRSRRKELIDAAAAAVILDEWLTAQRTRAT